MNITKYCSGYAGCLFLILFVIHLSFSQTPTRLGPASEKEIEKAKAEVQSHMNSFNAHKAFIYAIGMGNPDVVTQYEIWMKKYPRNINIPLSAGKVFHMAEMPQAKDFLLKAASIEPNNAEIWDMLSVDARMRGQEQIALEYNKKAVAAQPGSALYAYGGLTFFENADPDLYKSKVFAFAERFPKNDLGALAIYSLAHRTTDLNTKILYLQELRRLYPPQKFNWSNSGMVRLVDAYLETDPDKALLLATELSAGNADWIERRNIAESFIEINRLEKAGDFKAAVARCYQLKLPSFNYIDDFLALKKASLQEKDGMPATAYDSLCVAFAKMPTDMLLHALESYGKKLDKDQRQVDKDIKLIRNKTATVAPAFNLGLYTSTDSLNLDSLRGKVILLTFWFPGCSPCKAEFPHFQTVVDSFKDDSLVYIGINVLPTQDGYVLPFLKNNRFSFIPLRGSVSFAAKQYGAPGQPANFLIDKEGRIIFKDFKIDNNNHRTLELMIASLLKDRVE